MSVSSSYILIVLDCVIICDISDVKFFYRLRCRGGAEGCCNDGEGDGDSCGASVSIPGDEDAGGHRRHQNGFAVI